MIEKEKIKQILKLSRKIGTDSNNLINMMKHHTDEIKELYDSKNNHFAVETGDLIILSLQLLMIEGYSIEEIMGKCYGRFDKKFNYVV